MTDWKEYADYYIKRLRGPESDRAYHSLIEADDVIIPTLIDAFRAEKDPAIRFVAHPKPERKGLTYDRIRRYSQN